MNGEVLEYVNGSVENPVQGLLEFSRLEYSSGSLF